MASAITVVTAAKGGAGATTLCVELVRAMRETQRCAIVDADFSARRAIAVLTDSVRDFDLGRPGENLATATVFGDVAGVEFTSTISGAFTLTMENVATLSESLLEETDWCVVDAPQPYAAAVRPFIMAASHYMVVLEASLLGITGARSIQSEFAKFGLPANRIVFVCVIKEGRPEVQPQEMERLLGVRLLATIPPKHDRRYRKEIQSLAKLLETMRADPDTGGVGASVKVPLGDRRPSKRRPAGEQPAPNEAPVGYASLASANGNGSANGAADTRRAAAPVDVAARDGLKNEIHRALTGKLDVVSAGGAQDDAQRLADLRAQVEEVVTNLLRDSPSIFSAEEIATIRQEIIDEALGLGAIEEFVNSPDITEIMVNGAGQIYVERNGKLTETNKRFADDRQLRVVIERIIAPLGRRIDESQPMVDARLPDGSRVNAIIEPLALDGPTLTIRRFGAHRLDPKDLVKVGAIAPQMVDFLRACVEARLNILVCGGTGSGKTTFLNALSSFIPAGDRIVTIEDAAELKLDQRHVVRLEARPPNLQGAGEVKIRDLVRNSLRMRPDRIIVGECRGGETLDMLQAMNTGHDGSLTTIHANSARDAVSRIETLVMMAGFELPIKAIREQIASAIDIIVHTSRMRDGSRKVLGISEVVGLEGEVVTMQEITKYKQRGLDKAGKVMGDFMFTGVQPDCVKKFEEYGVSFSIAELGSMQSSVASSTW
jgi:pilus assembly protein CpaF